VYAPPTSRCALPWAVVREDGVPVMVPAPPYGAMEKTSVYLTEAERRRRAPSAT
jgi:hypothetical protein